MPTLNDFAGFLPFPEINEGTGRTLLRSWRRQIIRISILDELQSREENTCGRVRIKQQLGSQTLTNKRHTWRDNRGHHGSVLSEVFIAVDGHFASTKQCHISLIDLLPRPLESADGRSVKPGRNGSHGREVVQYPTALKSSQHSPHGANTALTSATLIRCLTAPALRRESSLLRTDSATQSAI